MAWGLGTLISAQVHSLTHWALTTLLFGTQSSVHKVGVGRGSGTQ